VVDLRGIVTHVFDVFCQSTFFLGGDPEVKSRTGIAALFCSCNVCVGCMRLGFAGGKGGKQ
jgi:hypothetical protein